MDLVEKALNTNGCKILELAEPDFNPVIIGQKIDALNKEISDLQHGAFATCFKSNGAGLNIVVCPTSGTDSSKIIKLKQERDVLIVHLKSLKLLNDEPRRNNKRQNSNPTDTD